jgi:hypothetical protein|tara:strand:- start:8 stop:313 length:306 start_codon:yes stop_codon:yes gene_type:complete
MKTLSVEDYKRAGEEFWPKYWYISKELGEDAKVEDILKVMETIGGIALKQQLEDKLTGPFGFNKKSKEKNEDGATIINSAADAPPGTVAVKENGQWAAYEL